MSKEKTKFKQWVHFKFFCSIIHLNLNIRGERRSGHLVKWNNATSSLSEELALVNSGSALFHHKSHHSPAHKGLHYQSFLSLKDANLKNIFLRHQAIDFSSLTWSTGDSIPKHRLVMAFFCGSLRSLCLEYLQMLKGKITSEQQPKIYIYIYIFIFTNCTYLHDLIKYWIIEIRTTNKGVHFMPQCYFLCKLELSRVPRKLKTVHIAEATIHC